MKINRTKNAIRNTKWGLIQRLVNILFPFLVRTVLIYTLSAEYAGLNSLFTSILSILSLTELGFSNAIVFSMYKPVAENDENKICALLNIYRKAYLIIGTIILVIGLLLIPLLPSLINGEIPGDINLYVLYLIYLINNVLSYFLYGYKTSLLSAHQREDIVSRNTLIYNVILYGLQCVVLIAFRNYYIYAIVIPLSTILLNILNNRAVKRMFPGYIPAGQIDSKEKAVLKKNIIGLMIWKIGGATRNTLDSIVVSMYLGLITVAIYNNYFYIVNGVTTLIGVVLTAITAGVGNKVAVETPEKNYEDFKKFHFYYMWIAGWCAICMLCLYQPFMTIWMGEELMFPDYIMFLFCYYFIMMKQGDINSVYYQAAGLWWEGKFRSIVEAIINLVLNFTLGYFWGVAGIILATIISYTCVYFYGSKFVFTKYFRNGKLKKFYLDNLYYLTITGLVGLGIFLFLGWLLVYQQSTWIVLGVSTIVCIILPNLAFAFIYGANEEKRTYLKQMVRMLQNSIRK